MTNYVPSIPDCERWEKYISNLAKNRADSKLKAYVKSDSPLGEIKIISPVEGDLNIVKTRVRQYKKKSKRNSPQTKPKRKVTTTRRKTTSGKTRKGKMKSKRPKSKRTGKTKRKRKTNKK